MSDSRNGERARPGTVTIQDIARKAGVSTATVSRTLANPEVVSLKTREKVNQAIAETGYSPNVVARNLRSRKANIVLVLVPNVANPFFAQVLRGIDDRLVEAGYDIIMGNLDNLREREGRYVDLAASGQIDGALLLSGRIPRSRSRAMSDLGLPIAALCAAIPGSSIPVVGVNDQAAARSVARHFLDLGHQRFGYIAGPVGNFNEVERWAGYNAALADAGIDTDAIHRWASDFNLTAGVEAGNAYLATSKRPTAVFAACDEAAIGFIKTVTLAGLGVPGDVSIVGFDGLEYGQFIQPTLTTICQPRYDLGRKGADVLLRLLQGEHLSGTWHEIEATWMSGATTGPPPCLP